MRPANSATNVDDLAESSNLDFGEQFSEGWDSAGSEPVLARFRDACDATFDWLDPLEAPVVELMLARRPRTFAAARAFDEAGKGLLYPLLAAAALFVDGPDAFTAILSCALATALSLALYPVLKQLVRRERPLAHDPDLGVGVAPVDRYSWPSGHSITAVAFLVPFALAGSSLLPLIGALTLLVLWSRIALGHHYPTDIACGATIGGAISGASYLVVTL